MERTGEMVRIAKDVDDYYANHGGKEAVFLPGVGIIPAYGHILTYSKYDRYGSKI